MYQNDLIIADKDLRILYMGDNIISTVIKKIFQDRSVTRQAI